MFDKTEPVNGYQLWSKKEKRPGVLNWRPRFAEIAASGDFGYTCGPWTFQPKTVNDSIVANGYFFTIWQKKKGSDWKFIYDGGTDQGPRLTETGIIKQNVSKTGSNISSMMEPEAAFIQLLSVDVAKGYKSYLTGNSVLCRNKESLASTSIDKQKLIDALPASIQYITLGSGIASGDDLGYTYGNTLVNGRKDFYLHVWRHEKNKWNLAVEMLRIQ
jgi:hypothetical protein